MKCIIHKGCFWVFLFFFCFEKVKMKCTRLGCCLRFIRLCCAGEAYFAACILMREKARMKEVWRGVQRVEGLCNSVT